MIGQTLFGYPLLIIMWSIWLVIGLICGYIADKKGRSLLGWFVIGCMMGFIGIAIISLISTKNVPKVATSH